MSVRVLTQVFEHSEAKLAGRLVLLALADSAHDDGITWIGQELIAEKARVSEQTVRRVLRELELGGMIETRKAQRGKLRINTYRVNVPGLLEPDYERLPFDLDQPFTDDRAISSVVDGDDRAFTPGTTEDPDRPRAREPIRTRKLETVRTPVGPPSVIERPADRPVEVDRKPVKDGEYQLASAVLAAFNNAAGTRYSGKDWIKSLIMRIREHPDLPLEAHEATIQHQLAHPWWTGTVSPSVIYGNGRVFEKAVHEAAGSGMVAPPTAEELASYGTLWGPGTEYATLAEARSARAGLRVIEGEAREQA